MTDQIDDAAFGVAIHARMIAGDPVASADLCERYLPTLERLLRTQYATTNEELIHDAAIQALFSYIERPDRFDPAKRSLRGYLVMAAKGDLLNLREKHKEWIDEVQGGDSVELDRLAGNREVDGDALADTVIDEIMAADLYERALALARDEEERTVLRLMLAGERSTTAFVVALGWQTVPEAEQRSRLYAMKDRLGKRLRRLREDDHD